MADFEPKWERADDEDLDRCTAVAGGGQCNLRAVPGSKFCPAHGGNKAFHAIKKQEMRNYRLSKSKARFQQRLIQLGNNDNITSLRDEIAILRIMIEERINSCADAQELMMISSPLSDLIMKVEKVVVSCNKLESKLGNLLDRTKAVQFAQIIVQIIGNYITDEEQLDKISDEILQALDDV